MSKITNVGLTRSGAGCLKGSNVSMDSIAAEGSVSHVWYQTWPLVGVFTPCVCRSQKENYIISIAGRRWATLITWREINQWHRDSVPVRRAFYL